MGAHELFDIRARGTGLLPQPHSVHRDKEKHYRDEGKHNCEREGADHNHEIRSGHMGHIGFSLRPAGLTKYK